MLFRRRPSADVLAVVKLYGFLPVARPRESICALVAEQLAALPVESFDYEVNYGRQMRYTASRFNKTIERFDGDVEQLLVGAPNLTHGIAAVALLALALPRRLYEFSFFTRTPDPAAWFVECATKALPLIEATYGYGRALRADASALSEGVPKRTFSGITYKVEPRTHLWKRDLTLAGGMKGVYAFNVWPQSVLQEPMWASVVAHLPAEAIVALGDRFSGISLSPDDLARIRNGSSELRDFVRP